MKQYLIVLNELLSPGVMRRAAIEYKIMKQGMKSKPRIQGTPEEIKAAGGSMNRHKKGVAIASVAVPTMLVNPLKRTPPEGYYA